MSKQCDDLLLAASELIPTPTKEETTIIPDDMEEWICTNDPSIDPLFRGMLLPKGAQDKTKAYIKYVRQQRRKLAQQQRIERQRQQEEYQRYLQRLNLTEEDEYCDNNDNLIITSLNDASLYSLNESNSANNETNQNHLTNTIDANIEEDISKLRVEEINTTQADTAVKVDNKSAQILEDVYCKPIQTSNDKNDKQPVQLMSDIKQSVNLQINPELSATKNFINLLHINEPLLTDQQKLQFLDKKFVNDNLGISLPLFIPYSDDESVRFINGHSRYINKVFIFNQQQWFITNNIHKRNVDKLLIVLEQMLETCKINEKEA